jgi:ribosomal protein L24
MTQRVDRGRCQYGQTPYQAESRSWVAGGIVEREAAIHVSNVMLFNPITKKATGRISGIGGWTQSALLQVQ